MSVMKTDGKILEYKAPIQVHQILSEFSHHAISDRLPVVKHLHPTSELLQGKLYYLVPLPQPAKRKTTKKVRFSEDVVEKERRSSGGCEDQARDHQTRAAGDLSQRWSFG